MIDDEYMEITGNNKHVLQNDGENVPKLPKLEDFDQIEEDDDVMLNSEPDLATLQANNNSMNEQTSSSHPYNVLAEQNPSNLQHTLAEPSSFSQNEQQQLPPPPQPPVERTYDFSKAFCLKTSDRILDDLRVDPLFLLKGEEGILSNPTFKYASVLSSTIKNSAYTYKPVFWNTNDPLLGSSQISEYDSDTTLQRFSGLLVPSNYSDLNFTNSRIFHYSITIRYKNNRLNFKNSFYGFLDDDLYEEDKDWLEPSDILEDPELISDDNARQILLNSLPDILDSATFISKETGTLIRVEIHPAMFGTKDLESFTLTEIQTRIATYNSQVQPGDSFNQVNITPHDCFIKFRKALSGAMTYQDVNDLKSIDLATTKLQVMLDIQLLLDKFFFVLSKNDKLGQLTPIHFASLGDYDFVTRDYFKRAILEIVYYIAITSTNKNDFTNYFSFSFHDIFQCIKEADISNQLQHWTHWNDQFYSENMVLLSICPFYNDQLICHMYELLTSFDPMNIPLYYDALTYCATSRYSEELPYYVTILKGRGLLGFNELKNIFSKLGFNNVKDCFEMSQIHDDQLLNAYQNQVIVATTKYEKVTFREMLDKVANFRSSAFLKQYLNTEPYFDIYDAYKLLDIDPSLDDSLLITFYDYKAAENGSNFDPNVARAFYTIVLARRSVILMSYIDINLPQFSVSNISLTDAYRLIGCLESADDLLVTRIFQERLHNDTGTDFRMLWKSLKTIGEYRKSKLIEGYLTSGIVNSTLLSVDQSPAGLNNIGNTCYLNSLLQYYFVIEPLRDYILNFNEVFNKEEFEQNEKYQIRRIGGRTVGLKETERSYQFMYQLRDLYYQLIHENDKCVTPSRELAYLAFSPISFEVEFESESDNENKVIDLTSPEPENQESGSIAAVKEDEHSTQLIEMSESEFNPEGNEENKEDKEKEVASDESEKNENVLSLGKSDNESVREDKQGETIPDIDNSTSDEDSLVIVDNKSNEVNQEQEQERKQENQTTIKKTAAVCKISPDQFDIAFEIGSQQDVTECISNVLIQMESAMKPESLDDNNEQLDMVKKLFYGKTKQRLVPVDSKTKEELADKNVRTKVESFLNLIVNIGDHPKDIYDALDTFFTEDLLELEDGEVKRSLTIMELPNILQIQIQRVQFDRERLIPVKALDPIPFEEKLYMDRYLETEDEVLIQKRVEIFHWKRRVQELTEKRKEILMANEQGMTIRDVLMSTRNYLTSDAIKKLDLPIDMNTLEVLDLEIDRLDNALLGINNELEMLQNNISQQFTGFNKIGYSIFAIFIHRGQASYGHYFIYIRDPKSNVYRKYNDEIVSEVSMEEVFNFSEGNTATPYYLTFIKDELLDKITPLQREIFVKESMDKLAGMNEEVGSASNAIVLSDEVLHMDVD